MVGAVLGSNLELTADMLFDKAAEERIAFVCEHIIIPYAGADEHLLYSGDALDALQQLDVFAVVGDEVRTRGRRETAAIRAYAVLELPLACGTAKIRRRTANVVDISLKVGQGRQQLGFAHDAVYAA